MPMPTALQLIRSHSTKLPIPQPTDLTGQVVLIIGANTGLGLEAAKELAKMRPAYLVLACRNREKGEAAIAQIHKETGLSAELLLVDLAEFSSVSAFATTYTERYTRLDILICNAGVVQPTFVKTKDGYEMNMQVNYLSALLAILLLLPIVARTGETYGTHPRIVTVGSFQHYSAKLESGMLETQTPLKVLSSDKKSVSSESALYALSKLLSIQLARTLQRALPSNTPLICVAVDPGFCHSDISRNMSWGARMGVKVAQALIARSPAEGGKTLVHAALAGVQARGGYMMDCQTTEPTEWLESNEGKTFEERVWTESLEILAEVDSRVFAVKAQHLS